MFRFQWQVLATSALLDEVRAAASDVEPANEELTASLARIFSLVGGVPLADEAWSVDECTRRGRAFIQEALLRQLRGPGRLSDHDDGYLAKPSKQRPETDEVIRSVSRVGINTADAATLRDLGLSAAIAQNIIDQRQRRGPIKSLDDLDERVPGIGPRTVEELAHAVHFALPEPIPWPYAPVQRKHDTQAFLSDLSRFVAAQAGTTPRARLLAALDALAVGAHAHPAQRMRRVRRGPAPPPAPSSNADWVGVLSGSAYYERLQRLFQAAQTRIDVCMFHAAATDQRHPTFRLLNALVAAHGRGVQVRMLLDQDRDEDLYRSTVINTPARNFLLAAGVPCRFDTSERLLHSKFVLVDDQYSVVGSHNWSAGSYFQFDDLSLLVADSALNTTMRSRFEGLWAEGA